MTKLLKFIFAHKPRSERSVILAACNFYDALYKLRMIETGPGYIAFVTMCRKREGFYRPHESN